MADQDRNEVQALIAAFRTGDTEAFDSLLSLYRPLLISTIRRYFTSDPQGEAYTEAVTAFHDAVTTYRAGEGTTFGLFAEICVSRRLKKLFEEHMKTDELPLSGKELASSDPEGEVVRRETYGRMMRLLCTVCSEKEYKVLRLYLSGLSVREIAVRMGQTEKQTENARTRAFAKIRANRDLFDL